ETLLRKRSRQYSNVLRERKARRRCCACYSWQCTERRKRRQIAIGFELTDPFGQLSHRRSSEEIAQRKLHLQNRTQLCCNAHCQQRMPSEHKKVIGNTNLRHS